MEYGATKKAQRVTLALSNSDVRTYVIRRLDQNPKPSKQEEAKIYVIFINVCSILRAHTVSSYTRQGTANLSTLDVHLL
jgi:hypothetical protein